MRKGHRLIGDTIAYGIALTISRAVSFFLLPFYARQFTAAQFGTFDFLISLNRAILLPTVLGTDSGLGLSIQGRDPSEQRRIATSCFVTQAVWGVFVALVLLLLAPSLSAGLFGDGDHSGVIVLTIFLFYVTVLNNFVINLAKWKRMAGRYLVMTVGPVGFGAALSVAFVWIEGEGVRGALLGMVLGGAIFVPVGIALCLRDLGRELSVAAMIGCLRLGLPFAATGATEFLFPFLVRFGLIATMGAAAVGIFGAANTICLGLMLINDAFSSAWGPYMLSPERPPLWSGESVRVMRLYAFFLILLTAAVTLVAAPLVSFLLGGGPYLQTAPIIGPLAFAYWFKSVRHNASVGLIVSGRNWTRALLNFITMMIALVFAYFFSIRWSITGTAWGFAGGEAIGLAVQTEVIRRLHLPSLDVRATVIMAAALLVLALLVGEAPLSTSAEAEIMSRVSLGAGFLVTLLLFGVVQLSELRAAFAGLRGVVARSPRI